jgi:hypothetical protein
MSHQRLSWDFVLAGNNDWMIPSHSSHARDAALRRLVFTKRWLVAGSVTLTGVFTAVAANAFPGKTIKPSSARAASAGHSSKASTQHQPRHTQSSQGSSSSLKPPAQAPQSTTPQESAPAQEPTPAPESAPAQESAPAKESPPAQEPAPVEHSEPAQPAPEAPVVSGGS